MSVYEMVTEALKLFTEAILMCVHNVLEDAIEALKLFIEAILMFVLNV